MIEQIILGNFKRFKEQTFNLSDNIILVGFNNTGKTTLLQAIAVWHLALQRWITERGPGSGSKAKERTGLAITRKDFTAIPLREMNLLWTNCSTALSSKDELKEGQQPGTPRVLEISVKGKGEKGDDWSLTMELTYRYPDLIHVKLAEKIDLNQIKEIIKNIQVVHVPPFSGIGAEKTCYDRAYQNLLIGQGKSGDILRNLLLEINQEKQNEWKELCKDIEEIFGYTLLPPVYEGRPFIICEYQPSISERRRQRGLPRLDISCAGSGFLQVLMLFGFFYARPASIILLDEPDAHLHIILQKQVYDRLREIARRRGCQLLIATHSEILVDSTSPEKIVSFFDHPHTLTFDTEKEQVREALKRLTSLDLLMAEQSSGVLYVEGETDFNLLSEWSRIRNHPLYDYFFKKSPFWKNNQGRDPREAKAHFFALKAVKPDINGVLILDGDDRQLPEHELSTEGLCILRWKRYEAENYLINSEVLARFVKGPTTNIFSFASAKKGRDYLKNELPTPVFNDPLADHDYLNAIPASKTLLPGFFKAAGMPVTKNEYYQIAAQMLPDEIPGEIIEKLDLIYNTFKV